jgi:hypothetical protein
MTTEQAFTEITDQLTLMGQYTVHDSIISEERTRYQLTHSRNATERLRQSYRRALEGRQPLPTGPVGHQAPPRPTRPLTGPSHQPPPSPEAARALAIANLDDDAFEALADLGDDPPDTSPHPMSLPDDFEPATPADIQAAIARTLAAKDPT